jgi:hypothetical protein
MLHLLCHRFDESNATGLGAAAYDAVEALQAAVQRGELVQEVSAAVAVAMAAVKAVAVAVPPPPPVLVSTLLLAVESLVSMALAAVM